MTTCFWGDDDEPCQNETPFTIYWDGADHPICEAHLPEAEEAINDELNYIDDQMLYNAY